MIIRNIHSYREGGTKLIETDQGNFYIPGRLDKSGLTGKVMKGDYFKGDAVEVVEYAVLHELIRELAHGHEVYSEIKRIMR